jgi:hypothetical protein
MKNYILLFLIATTKLISYGQYIGIEEIEDSIVRPWVAKSEIEYSGVYHFGESESESSLKIFFIDTIIIAQISSADREEEKGGFKSKYKNLSNVKINRNGHFFSDQYSGQFVFYSEDFPNNRGLKINNPWFSWFPKGKYEIGYLIDKNPFNSFYGKYPKASTQILNKSDIDSLSKWDLQIMRNEIFARYNFIFINGGIHEEYFNKQSWYSGQHKDVSKFLTQVELINIEFLKKIEEEKQ